MSYEHNLPFDVAVRAGLVKGVSLVQIVGHDLAAAQADAILAPANATGIIAPNAILATPSTVIVSSTDQSADDATGTGSNSYTIDGLDADGDVQTETVLAHATDGRTGVASLLTYSAINHVQVLAAGSGLKNAGTIWVGTGSLTAGVPAVGLCSMEIGKNASNTGCYTVPRNHMFLIHGVMFSGAGTGAFKGINFELGIHSVALGVEVELWSASVGPGGAVNDGDVLEPAITAGQQLRMRGSALAVAAFATARVDGYLYDLGRHLPVIANP